jgi:hypothetical protein
MNDFRRLITLCEGLNEMIVHRDRFIQEPELADSRRTVVAINPTKAEWDKFFPRGAAGVLLKNGKIVVGDGNMLPHDAILDYAKVPQNQEKYRLQLCRNGAWVELWMTPSEWDHHKPDEQEVREYSVKHYGETIEQIEAQLAKAVAPFMGSAPVKAIPLGDEQQPLIAGDEAFVNTCFTGDGGRPVDLGY